MAFQIPIGLRPPVHAGDLVSAPVDARDVPAGVLLFGHLRHRPLPVASARFADQLVTGLQRSFDVT